CPTTPHPTWPGSEFGSFATRWLRSCGGPPPASAWSSRSTGCRRRCSARWSRAEVAPPSTTSWPRDSSSRRAGPIIRRPPSRPTSRSTPGRHGRSPTSGAR
ncbi:MAG: hypothetical protein AVDCRST_MAG50-305, partial [uncultured Acidimicrobiales bacterium]